MPDSVTPVAAAQDQTHLDVVCGMRVAPSDRLRAVHEDHTYYFCGEPCVARFNADPSRYLGGKPGAKDSSSDNANGIFTCPMHPEVRVTGPASCPLCGMALEPITPGGEFDDSELRDFTRRLYLSAPLAAALLVLTMTGDALWLGASAGARNLLELALATPVVWWAGWPLLARGPVAAHVALQHVHLDHGRRARGLRL